MSELHIDASAIVAVLLGEDDRAVLLDRMAEFDEKTTSLVSAFEAVMAFGRATGHREEALAAVTTFLEDAEISVVPEDVALLGDLGAAHLLYGKGSGHAARLNLGDCFSYAIAARNGVPLLYKGNDFSHTDLG